MENPDAKLQGSTVWIVAVVAALSVFKWLVLLMELSLPKLGHEDYAEVLALSG